MTTHVHARTADVPWPAEAPDVRLGGLLLLDSFVQPVSPAHRDSEAPAVAGADAGQRDWNVYCVRLEGDPGGREYALVCELFICADGWHLKVSALTPLQLRGDLRNAGEELGPDGLAKRYGPWVTHVLWDFAAQHARILGSGVLRSFDLPSESPEAVYEVPRYLTAPDADD